MITVSKYIISALLFGNVYAQSQTIDSNEDSITPATPSPTPNPSQEVLTLPLFVVEPGPPIIGSLVTQNEDTTIYQIWDDYPITTGMFDGDGRHAYGHGHVGPFTITYLPTGVNYEQTYTGQAITRGQCTTNGAYHACSYSTISTWNGCSIVTYRGHDVGNGKFFFDYLKVTMDSRGPPNKGVVNTLSYKCNGEVDDVTSSQDESSTPIESPNFAKVTGASLTGVGSASSARASATSDASIGRASETSSGVSGSVNTNNGIGMPLVPKLFVISLICIITGLIL